MKVRDIIREYEEAPVNPWRIRLDPADFADDDDYYEAHDELSAKADPRKNLHELPLADQKYMIKHSGDFINDGAYRSVYAHKGRADAVIKLDYGGSNNMTEWNAWQAVQGYPKIAKWFAPCLALPGEQGHIMLQARTMPLAEADAPPAVPRFFLGVDLRPNAGGNWGLLAGRPVCHDYQTLTQFCSGEQSAAACFRRIFADAWMTELVDIKNDPWLNGDWMQAMQDLANWRRR